MKCDQGTNSLASLLTTNLYFENPVRHILNLPEGIYVSDIEMFNLLGKKVKLKNENSKRIDISCEPRGIYLIKYKGLVQKIVLD
jgi:hypothetical protein